MPENMENPLKTDMFKIIYNINLIKMGKDGHKKATFCPQTCPSCPLKTSSFFHAFSYLRAGSTVSDPVKKATRSVTEVTVMATPAFLIMPNTLQSTVNHQKIEMFNVFNKSAMSIHLQ